MRRKQIESAIFWPSITVIFCATILLIFFPNAESKVNIILDYINHTFDWLFLISVFGMFIFLVWLAQSKYGKVKFGDPEDKPEFSTYSWIAMLFNAGIGSSLFYWAMVEPVYYMSTPPFGIAAGSPESMEWSLAYGMFHWGFNGWAMYTIPAIAVAYSLTVRKNPLLRPSSACAGILGNWYEGWIGKLIDSFIVVGLVGGIGSALGVNVPMVSTIVGDILGIGDSLPLQLVILVFWTSMFGISAYLGVNRGIQKLSDINSVLAIVLVFFVLIAGPMTFILSNFSNSFGLMLNNFFRMSFYTDPITKSGFPQSWTVFYWAWWITFAVYMGIFVARVSKGRTIKELIIAEVICGSVGCFVFFAVFGGYAIYLESNGIISVVQIFNEQGPTAVILTILKTLPFGKLILPVFAVISLISQATGLDAAAYTLAAIVSKQSGVYKEPTPKYRLFWAIILGFVALALILVGGLKVIQLSSLIVAIPVLIVMYLFIFSMMKWLKEDHSNI